MKRIALVVVAAIFALSLAGCSSGQSVSQSSESVQEITVTMIDKKLFWLDYSIPDDWKEKKNSNQNQNEYTPPMGGMAFFSAEGNINFPDNYKEYVDSYIATFTEETGAEITDLEESKQGEAAVFTADMTSKDGASEGRIRFILSGHGLYSAIILIPKDDYLLYAPIVNEVLDSMQLKETHAPLGGDSASNSAQTAQQSDSSSQAPSVEKPKTYGPSIYKVGTDIPAGEYKLTANSSDAYYGIKDGSGADAKILSNNIFDGQAYVTISDGQYLELRRCTAEAV